MNPLHHIAEARIEEALKKGAFDHVQGKGEPLQLEDLSRVPGDLRGGYLLLKGSGYLPPEMELKKEALRLEDLIAACRDPEEERVLRERRNAAVLRFQLLMERRGTRGTLGEYAEPVARKLG